MFLSLKPKLPDEFVSRLRHNMSGSALTKLWPDVVLPPPRILKMRLDLPKVPRLG